MKKLLSILLMLASGWTFAANKPQLDFTAPPFNPNAIAIPDDGYDGTLASMACMNVTGPGGAIVDMNAVIAVDHTWVGDLVIKVVAPDNTVLTLMSRPGLAETADDGTNCCGDSSDISAAAPVNFLNGAATSGEDMGSTITGSQVVCTDDGICDYAPAPGAGPGTDFSQFFGMESAGTWQICVGDSASGDTGQIDEVVSTLNFTIATATPVVTPPSGTAISMDGTTGPANGSVTIGNDAAAAANITSVNCAFSGPDAAQFTITTPMPVGPIAPGGSANIDFNAAPGAGEVFNATLTCTVTDGANTAVFSWPVTAFGAAAIIPTLGWWALLMLIGLMVLMAWRGHRFVRS